MKLILKLQTETQVQEVLLNSNDSVVFGRSSKATHKVLDELMSGTHCRFILRPPKLRVTDLESKNGTYLNGIRVDQCEMFLGDEIQIGSTKVTIKLDKLDPQSIMALTFPGKPGDRIASELKLDFDGTRTLNQSLVALGGKVRRRTDSGSVDKEVNLRLKADSTIKLSKEEVRLKFKKLASVASTLDTVLMIGAVTLPLFILNILILMEVREVLYNRLVSIAAMEALSVGLIYLFNFKVLRFTLGEKVSGIQTKYFQQN